MTSAAISPRSFPLVTAEPAYSSRAHLGDTDETRRAHRAHMSDPTTGSEQAGSSDGNHTDTSSGKDDDEKWIWVLDPMTRKLRVPVHLLNPTQAIATSGTVPSLCIAYLEGRCRHPWCRQAHVLPAAIPKLRYEALNAPTCCHLHNDPHDISKLTNRFRYIRIVNNGPSGNSELIPTERVASTVGLLRYLVHNVLPKKQEEAARRERAGAAAATGAGPTAEGGRAEGAAADDDDVLELPAKFICRLHLAHRCRYLEDCNNIHLCREYELQLQPPPHMLGTLSGVTTSTRTVTVGDACYTVTPLAVGDVTDEDFRAICDAQKSAQQKVEPTPTGGGLAPGVGVIPWTAQNPFDSVMPNSSGSSPMLYGRGGPATPLSGPANVSTTFLPPVLDCWQTSSALASVVAGSSPCLQSALPHGTGMDRSTTSHLAGGHLRVYDVRPKKGGAAGVSSSGSPSAPATAAAAAAAATAGVMPNTAGNSTSTFITAYVPNATAIAGKEAGGATNTGASSSPASKPSTPGLSGGPNYAMERSISGPSSGPHGGSTAPAANR